VVDYVEDPIGRIVNVHWDDKKPPPDDNWPVTLRCGTYNFNYELNWAPSGSYVTTNYIGPLKDPFLIRDPDNPYYNVGRSVALILTTNGIRFGSATWVLMTPASYHVSTEWDISTSSQGEIFGLGIVHTSGPRDFNRYPQTGGLPWPTEPFLEFGSGPLEWDYNVNPGDKGMWIPKSSGGEMVWDDPTRFDPGYGGDAWLIVFMKIDDETGWQRRSRGSMFFTGDYLSPDITQGSSIYDNISTYGQQIHTSITAICPTQDMLGYIHEYGPPLVIYDDGTLVPL